VALPAAAVSGLLFAAGIGLMLLVRRTERSASDTFRGPAEKA
jgi:hypothetical protein